MFTPKPVEPASGLLLAQQGKMDPGFVPWIMMGFGLIFMYVGVSVMRSRKVYHSGRIHTIGKPVAVLSGLTCLLLGALACAAGAMIQWAGPK